MELAKPSCAGCYNEFVEVFNIKEKGPSELSPKSKKRVKELVAWHSDEVDKEEVHLNKWGVMVAGVCGILLGISGAGALETEDPLMILPGLLVGRIGAFFVGKWEINEKIRLSAPRLHSEIVDRTSSITAQEKAWRRQNKNQR